MLKTVILIGGPSKGVTDTTYEISVFCDKTFVVYSVFVLPLVGVVCRVPVRLKIEVHEIHLICEIHIPKYRNPLQLSEIHCLKVDIHEIHVQTGIAKNRNPQNPHRPT